MNLAVFKVVCLVVLVVGLALSSGVAFAGFDWYGECPPRSEAGFANANPDAVAQTAGITPSANSNAWADGATIVPTKGPNAGEPITGSNPGKK